MYILFCWLNVPDSFILHTGWLNTNYLISRTEEDVKNFFIRILYEFSKCLFFFSISVILKLCWRTESLRMQNIYVEFLTLPRKYQSLSRRFADLVIFSFEFLINEDVVSRGLQNFLCLFSIFQVSDPQTLLKHRIFRNAKFLRRTHTLKKLLWKDPTGTNFMSFCTFGDFHLNFFMIECVEVFWYIFFF